MMRTRSIDEEFQDFHRINPGVYRELARLARELLAQGHRKIGIKMLFEVLRWQSMLKTSDPVSEFKLNNNYHSRYARLLMKREPDLAGVFEIRELWEELPPTHGLPLFARDRE